VCRVGAAPGVDPTTNELPAARVSDLSSSTPVALPGGGVVYGGYTTYNGNRGHLVALDKDGARIGAYDFGWDVTPAVYRHDGAFSIIVKDNWYGVDTLGHPVGPYYITQLSSAMQVEWRFKATNTLKCTRHDDGTVSCDNGAAHPNGFEWCINAPAVDANGTIYVNNEDGNLYAIGQGGVEMGHFFMEMSITAAYTPLALDRQGRVYTMNFGKLSVFGQGSAQAARSAR
jgi:hypothetical protein